MADGTSGSTGGESAAALGVLTISILVILLVGALAWAVTVTFFDDDDEPVIALTAESRGPDGGITLAELTSDADALVGSTVVVSGEVSYVVGREAGVTDEATPAPGVVLGAPGESLLVVGTQVPQLTALGANDNLAEGDVVQVTGTVREFDLLALEEELGVDLDDGVFEAYENRPVLVASAVNLVPSTASRQGERIALTAQELTESPQEYLTLNMVVRDLTIDDPDQILSPRAAALGDDIIVVGADGPMPLAPGFIGTVTGTLIEASSARLLEAVDLPPRATEPDLLQDIGIEEQEYDRREYVLVADSIEPRR